MDNNLQIPIYQLFIHPMDLQELRKDIWCDEPLPARLTVLGKKCDIDIQYRGSHIRKFKKKSYQVTFFKPKVFQGAKELHLNAEYKDPSLIRNKLSFDFFSSIGCLAPQSRHVLLKLNGKIEGVYLELESVDEYFLKKRGLPDGTIFYAVDGDANFSLMSDLDKETKKSLTLGYEKKWGTKKDEGSLQEMILKINTIPKAEFGSEVSKYINVSQYIKWIAGIVLTQNYDGFVHNYSLYRNGESGLFEMIPWDYDATWGRDVNGRSMSADYVRIEGFNTLTARILDVDIFRKQYRELLESLLNHQFTTEYLKPQIEDLYNKIRPAVLLDPHKKDHIEKFDGEPAFICSYIENRNSYIRSKLYKLE